MIIKEIYSLFWVLLIINSTIVFSQELDELTYKYPIDTLLIKDDINIFQRFTILPLKFWQMKSYNDFKYNCQFYPSCSNYCALSIYNDGFLIGSIKGMDRYFRCNKSAQGKYVIHSAGTHNLGYDRLLDNYKDGIINTSWKTDKQTGIILSLIPGLSRAYYRQYNDAFNSFKYTTVAAIATYFLHINDFNVLKYFTGYATFVFWSTDIYAVIRLNSEKNK